ncbi:MAG TPA: tRNA lysidine(34) synthetase TilS [Burkholderiaceae bacterium]|jgi:tRNA(Ile)-lysidine synthase
MQETAVVEAFERAFGEILTRVCVSAPQDIAATTNVPASSQQTAVAIAYSGGLDSSALLHLAHHYATEHRIRLFAFHIHHGISPNADRWLAHCKEECLRLGITFDARQIKLPYDGKSGVEEAARIRRYAALGELCRAYQVGLLLTAHHEDDQAETVLLQLLRGSGVAGMSGMDVVNIAPDLLGDENLHMARPLLSVSRAALSNLVAKNDIAYVDDESNTDPRYARNALRHQVMPVLAKVFPGFQGRFARTAQHAQAAQRMLIELAAQDLEMCADGECLDIQQLRKLSSDRMDNVLRYWFGSHRMRMPSTSWLSEMRTQLLDAKEDAQLCVTHADCHIRRHRDRVYLTPRLNDDLSMVELLVFRWQGEEKIYFAGYHGTLYFEPAEQGIDSEWLQQQDLQIHYRQGGERLKPALNRPTKSLKYHYQALDIPAWERERLPLITTGKHLLFAAGIGMDCHQLGAKPAKLIQFRWQPDLPAS